MTPSVLPQAAFTTAYPAQCLHAGISLSQPFSRIMQPRKASGARAILGRNGVEEEEREEENEEGVMSADDICPVREAWKK